MRSDSSSRAVIVPLFHDTTVSLLASKVGVPITIGIKQKQRRSFFMCISFDRAERTKALMRLCSRTSEFI
jgi:hypothetical protein